MRTRMKAAWIAAALAGISITAGDAWAQRAGEITFFSGIGFRGQTYTLIGPRENIQLPWQVRSIRLRQGEAWDVCTRPRFGAPCNRLAENHTDVRLTVASARPVRGGAPGGTPAGGPSLRGATAEFFVAPSDARGRVESCRQGTAACAAQSADRFCRTRGWVGSSYERQETVGGRNFLSDVLCTRTG